MQKMPFYLSICGILEIGEKQNWKTFLPLVELSAGGVANESMKITLILTENAYFPIKRDYLRMKKCYFFSH